MPIIKCKDCGRRPADIPEILEAMEQTPTWAPFTPDQFVIRFDGSYNQHTGLFQCIECFAKEGSEDA